MRHLSRCLLLIAAFAAPAAAEPPTVAAPKAMTEPAPKQLKMKKLKIRVFGASSPKIGCSAYTAGMHCEGLERYRIGMGSTQVAFDAKNGVGPVVTYQVVSRQSGSLLASQAIAAVGVRKVVGRGWIQGGPGIARTGVAAGPRSVGIMKTLSRPRLAVSGGVGVSFDASADEPASLALDFGSTVDAKAGEPQIYQVGASVVQRF